MEVKQFWTHEYSDRLAITPYGTSVEIQKRKAGKSDYYNYRVGSQRWGKYLTLTELNEKLKPYKIRVENKRK